MAAFDPQVILATIAADEHQPGATRVAACRAFLAEASGQQSTTREESGLALLDKRTLDVLNLRVH